MCVLVNADERLLASRPANSINLVREPPTHPVHYLQKDDKEELRISADFRKAFGVDLIVHRNAGSQVPLYVGDRPNPGPGEDRVSVGYLERLELLPTLESQGDGMRSFAGVLLATSVGRESIVLVDEPEAFLHPPQSRLLGRMLVTHRRRERQLFIATHSSDIIRGILDAESHDVRVLRIQRRGSANEVSELDNMRIRELWSDPLLRHSNILDGLVHEHVIVCESDSDCRFYSAMIHVVMSGSGDTVRRPDVMLIHAGGKDRIASVIRALRGVAIPVTAILDFDVLRTEETLRQLVRALEGDWPSVETDWKLVKSSVDSRRPDVPRDKLQVEIEEALRANSGEIVTDNTRERIRKALKRSTPWALAKEMGSSYVPPGGPSAACQELLKTFRGIGLFVVEVGELESFARTVGGHGPRWVNDVLSRDLAGDQELSQAREFVADLVARMQPSASNPDSGDRPESHPG